MSSAGGDARGAGRATRGCDREARCAQVIVEPVVRAVSAARVGGRFVRVVARSSSRARILRWRGARHQHLVSTPRSKQFQNGLAPIATRRHIRTRGARADERDVPPTRQT